MLLHQESGFRDELIATALVLTVTIGGSFYLLHRFGMTEDEVGQQGSSLVLGVQSGEDASGQSSAGVANVGASPTPSPSPSPTPTPTPTPSPTTQTLVEIPYGSDQTFENADYKITFADPKLIVGTARKFEAQVVLANKSVEGEGLTNAILATITKEGQVVADNVPMSLSETKPIKIGQQLTFTATLGMIEGTEITQLQFKPIGGVAPTTFSVSPI